LILAKNPVLGYTPTREGEGKIVEAEQSLDQATVNKIEESSPALAGKVDYQFEIPGLV